MSFAGVNACAIQGQGPCGDGYSWAAAPLAQLNPNCLKQIPNPGRCLHERGDAQSRQSDGSGECGDQGGKSVISMLQEYVQCSKKYQAPSNQPILQWTFDTRMADRITLEFRAT